MQYKVEEYIREDGSSPYEEWFMKLDPIAAAKLTTVKLKMEQGNLSNVNGSAESVNTGLTGGLVTGFISVKTEKN